MNVPRTPQSNAKFRFWLLVVLIMLVAQLALSVGLAFLSIFLHRWLGIRYELGGYGGGLIVPVYVAAFISATAIGRRLGFVEPRRMETLRRLSGLLPAPLETLELRTSDSLRKQLMIACLVIACLITVLALLSGSTNHTRIYAFAASGVFFALGLLIFWRGKSDSFELVARIDRDGITASQGFRRRSAAWREIEAVEILMLPGAPGGPVTRSYTLLGQNAKRLFVFNLLFVPPAEQDKFERVLREAFSTPSNAPDLTN